MAYFHHTHKIKKRNNETSKWNKAPESTPTSEHYSSLWYGQSILREHIIRPSARQHIPIGQWEDEFTWCVNQ